MSAARQSITLHITDMERTARNIGVASVQVSQLWLTVRFIAREGKYTYKYGRHSITREGAIIVLDGG